MISLQTGSGGTKYLNLNGTARLRAKCGEPFFYAFLYANVCELSHPKHTKLCKPKSSPKDEYPNIKDETLKIKDETLNIKDEIFSGFGCFLLIFRTTIAQFYLYHEFCRALS